MYTDILTSDEKDLLLLYVDDTRVDTIENLCEMIKYLTLDEKDLVESAEKLLGILYGISDDEFEKIAEECLTL